MADDTTTPWYMNLGTWINILQGLLGLLIAAGGSGFVEAHPAEAGNISAGLGVAGLGVAHQVRSIRASRAGLRPVERDSKSISKY